MARRIDADDIGKRAADIDADRERAGRGVHVSNHAVFRQNRQLAARQAQFPAKISTLCSPISGARREMRHGEPL